MSGVLLMYFALLVRLATSVPVIPVKVSTRSMQPLPIHAVKVFWLSVAIVLAWGEMSAMLLTVRVYCVPGVWAAVTSLTVLLFARRAALEMARGSPPEVVAMK